MRTSSDNSKLDEIREFSEWILNIKDRKVGKSNDDEADVEIPHGTLIRGGDDPISVRVKSAYLDLEDHIWETTYFRKELFLLQLMKFAGMVNDHVFSRLPSIKEYT